MVNLSFCSIFLINFIKIRTSGSSVDVYKRQTVRPAQDDSVIGRDGCGEIIAAVRMTVYVRVRPLHNPWFVPFQLFFHFSALLFFIFF